MIITKTFPAKTFNNVFSDLFGTLQSNMEQVNNYTNVPVNINEQERGYEVSLLAPGRNKEAFKVSVDNGLLTISYETENKEDAQKKYVRQEFAIGNFKRTFTLDKKMNAEAIEAKYADGILSVFVPKIEEVVVSPKQISIQ